MNIRCMQPDDYDAVYDLWSHCSGVGLRSADDSPAGIGQYLRRNPTTCFVAESGGQFTGAILSGHDGRRGYIYHLAVADAYRRNGIGKALVEHALTALEKEGIRKVALVAFTDNTLGNQFWESQGFILREDLYYRNKALNECE